MSSPENHTSIVNTFEKLYDSRLLKQFSLYLKNEKIFCFQIFAFGSLNVWQFDRLKKRNGCIWLKKGQSDTLRHGNEAQTGSAVLIALCYYSVNEIIKI